MQDRIFLYLASTRKRAKQLLGRHDQLGEQSQNGEKRDHVYALSFGFARLASIVKRGQIALLGKAELTETGSNPEAMVDVMADRQ